LISGTAAALASPSMTLLTGPQPPLCYCHCELEKGAHKCTKMCELPQYEKRWWANSCHKKAPDMEQGSSSDPKSRKTNRREYARL